VIHKIAKATMPTVAAVALLILATATVSHAGGPPIVPEIEPTTGLAAITIVAGAVLIIRGRRKK
jgi:hypothetical protein